MLILINSSPSNVKAGNLTTQGILVSTPADVRTAVVPVEMRKPTDDVSNFSSSDDGAGKVIYTKYYKKETYALKQEMSFGCFKPSPSFH